MHIDEHWGTLGQGLGVLILTAAMAGCGGGGAGSSSSAGASSSSGGSTSGSTSGSTTMIFQQPQEAGITGHLFVPNASNTSAPLGVFEMVYWQTNPGTPNGQLVPITWDAGTETGFTPTSLTATELGFQNVPGTSTAQMQGNTVGAYINSAGLPGSPDGQKMMITPRFAFASETEPVPFSTAASSLNGSMELQVPTAVGNDTYVNVVFLFEGPSGVRISFAVAIFRNGWTNPQVATGFDEPTSSYQLNSPLGVDQRFVSIVAGSAGATGTPWLGWQHFEWSISQAQFAAALNYLVAQFPGQVQSTDPTQYMLAEMHLNAEFHFQPDPAQLGWSMSGWQVWTTQ